MHRGARGSPRVAEGPGATSTQQAVRRPLVSPFPDVQASPRCAPIARLPPLRKSARAVASAKPKGQTYQQAPRVQLGGPLLKTSEGERSELGPRSKCGPSNDIAFVPTKAEKDVAADDEHTDGTLGVSLSSPRSTTVLSALVATPPDAGLLEKIFLDQQYVELYFIVSAHLVRHSKEEGLAQAELERMQLLLSYRCLCSYYLLCFTEACEDGVAALQMLRRQRQRCAVEIVPDKADAKALPYRVAQALIAALVMRELYSEALDFLGGELVETIVVPPHTSSETMVLPSFTTWQQAIPSLEAFRQFVFARRWRDAAHIVHDNEAVLSCVLATPLCAMLAFMRIEMDDPSAAQAVLLPYLAGLPEPLSWEQSATAPVEHLQLWKSYTSHYVFCTTLLAKASFLSGIAYVNIAAALLQRSLRISPSYAPAHIFAEFLLVFESKQQRLDAAVSAKEYAQVLAVTTEMLTMRELTRHVQAELYLSRTQAQWMLRRPLQVLQEASLCLQRNAHVAVALRLRADALRTVERGAEAAVDYAAAVQAQPRMESIFAELQRQRADYEKERAAAEAQRGSANAFGSLPGISTPCTSRTKRQPSHFDVPHSPSLRSKMPPSSSPPTRTHYEILGVQFGATEAEIRQRYRLLSLRYHPDRLVGSTASHREIAEEEFKQLGNAYSVLSDAHLRATYDATLFPPSSS